MARDHEQQYPGCWLEPCMCQCRRCKAGDLEAGLAWEARAWQPTAERLGRPTWDQGRGPEMGRELALGQRYRRGQCRPPGLEVACGRHGRASCSPLVPNRCCLRLAMQMVCHARAGGPNSSIHIPFMARDKTHNSEQTERCKASYRGMHSWI